MHLRAKLSPTLLFMTFFITPKPSYLQIRSLEFFSTKYKIQMRYIKETVWANLK